MLLLMKFSTAKVELEPTTDIFMTYLFFTGSDRDVRDSTLSSGTRSMLDKLKESTQVQGDQLNMTVFSSTF